MEMGDALYMVHCFPAFFFVIQERFLHSGFDETRLYGFCFAPMILAEILQYMPLSSGRLMGANEWVALMV